MTHLSINLNSYVYLEMEEKDFRKYHSYYHEYEGIPAAHKKEFNIKEYRAKCDQTTGLFRMQIHTFLSVFGDSSYIGGFLPCKGNIIFDIKDLTEFKPK